MIKKILLGLVLLFVLAVIAFFTPGVFSGDLENETRVVVEKPRQDVWEKFRDESKMGEWLEGFKSIKIIEGEPQTVGSKHRITFENDGQEIEMIQTMTKFDKGEGFAFNLANDVMYSDIDVRLVDKGLVTEVIQKEKYHGQNVFWHSLFYWLKSTMAENSLRNMNSFKKYAEGA
ncbi:MAG: SRPBCC family protein [Acidobacteriota bacterium]|nr:SRPBCC family protein [Acidobacteriota bacterium]MDH3529344.1 SRPBCC family protein [Acidobacteriota bacterium]